MEESIMTQYVLWREKLKFFDLFAGIGGFRLGMERAGHECIGSCEWDKHARETYKKNFGSYPEYNDVKDLHPQSLPYFDVLCAGFPCQAFSHAGKRRGFEDTRGTIFFEIIRIARERKPRYLFLENVKGLLHHDKRRTFRTILASLDELGYDAEWRVFNSKEFTGQNRERVFIVAHLRGERTRQVFTIRENNTQIRKPQQTEPQAISVENTKANGRRIKPPGFPSFTLSRNCGIGVKINNVYRYFTVKECERLQGLPDNWTIGSDTQRKNQIGNAVTVDVVEYIAKELRLG
uniref:Cytosine-specific methyltransferase n=1 Tax=uncultured marine virus TaxID=186617 RepID=A0A0F7L6V1_9VIRU|nr:DNA methyltransferase [uncultured marine virus]